MRSGNDTPANVVLLAVQIIAASDTPTACRSCCTGPIKL